MRPLFFLLLFLPLIGWADDNYGKTYIDSDTGLTVAEARIGEGLLLKCIQGVVSIEAHKFFDEIEDQEEMKTDPGYYFDVDVFYVNGLQGSDSKTIKFGFDYLREQKEIYGLYEFLEHVSAGTSFSYRMTSVGEGISSQYIHGLTGSAKALKHISDCIKAGPQKNIVHTAVVRTDMNMSFLRASAYREREGIIRADRHDDDIALYLRGGAWDEKHIYDLTVFRLSNACKRGEINRATLCEEVRRTWRKTIGVE